MASKKKPTPKRASPKETSVYELVATDKLRFDAENPRLVEYLDDKHVSQDELLRVLWQLMAVDELAMSIAASGYWDHEPVFVVKENGHDIVIEGNRRLAAVKLLLDKDARESLRATNLPKITVTAKKRLQSLPVIRTTREDSWQYFGFKHVNGPAKWDSYSRAQYIAEVHNQFDVPLCDIANQIGDRHNSVQRLYRALMVIEQAEKARVFQRENRFKKRFSFSHITTALGYEGFISILKLRDESGGSRTPVPMSRMEELGEVCKWLYGDKSLDLQPVVQSQNPDLRQLDEVLHSKEATKALRAGLPLSLALELSYGDEAIFQKALIQSKEALVKARGTLTTGFHGAQDHLRLGNEIYNLALDLVEEMERIKTPRRRRTASGKSSK